MYKFRIDFEFHKKESDKLSECSVQVLAKGSLNIQNISMKG